MHYLTTNDNMIGIVYLKGKLAGYQFELGKRHSLTGKAKLYHHGFLLSTSLNTLLGANLGTRFFECEVHHGFGQLGLIASRDITLIREILCNDI